jgi:hypothetical protein
LDITDELCGKHILVEVDDENISFKFTHRKLREYIYGNLPEYCKKHCTIRLPGSYLIMALKSRGRPVNCGGKGRSSRIREILQGEYVASHTSVSHLPNGSEQQTKAGAAGTFGTVAPAF